jgi:protein ImuB
LRDTEQENDEVNLVSSDRLDAVNVTAARSGVRAGQSIAEASVFLPDLRIRALSRGRVEQALGKIAELALKFGTVSAIEPPSFGSATQSKQPDEEHVFDTVWIDITGVAHLYGGEEALATEIASSIRVMGHMVRIGIADGPWIAQALARWGKPNKASNDSQGIIIAPPGRSVSSLRELPIVALPVTKEQATWLFRCGIRKIGDLERLPRATLAARLDNTAFAVLDFLEGRDEAPLRAYRVPSLPFEELSFEESIVGTEPLLFILRGLMARLSTRLEARGQAARALSIDFVLDGAIARLRGCNPREVLDFALPAPVFRQDEMSRIITARVRRVELGAPVTAIRLAATQVTHAEKLQLGFSRVLTGASGDRAQGSEALPVILAELAAEIGNDRFGVLEQISSHLPEKKSALASADSLFGSTLAVERNRAKTPHQRRENTVPTRVLKPAVPFKAELQVGETVALDHQVFTLDQVCFERRLDHVEWWQGSGVSRDYWRVWLRSPVGDLEALVFVDRKSHDRFLQAIYD